MKISVCPVIDKLLEGGLEAGTITNFYGPPATGKTNIALVATASVSKHGEVVFVDTEGGFSEERVKQIGVNTANVKLIEPKTWEEQKDFFKNIEKICRNARLVVVDSIVSLWRIAVNEKNANDVNKELSTQLSLLSKIARKFNIPVIITNQVYSDMEGNIELSSKNIVKWWSKNLIEIMHAGRSGCRIARIVRARSLPEDKKIEFEIVGDGLKEVSKLRIF